LVFAEPEADLVTNRIEGAELVAPDLLGFELANVCLTKIRRSPDQRHVLLAAFHLRGRFPVEIMDVDHFGALALAERTRLTVYDASYLWLARQLGAELITLDRRLATAAAAF
jgi:predicted nucleic acid-binding protein